MDPSSASFRQALMTTLARQDLRVLDIGPPAWCWSRLACTSDATLSFSTSQGRFTVDVRYTLGHELIAIAMPSLDAVGWQAAGRSATLKISGTTPDDLRWSVRANGYAYRAGDHLRGASADHARVAVRVGLAWLALSSLQVRGHYETMSLDGMP